MYRSSSLQRTELGEPTRSARSLEFESFWRNLRNGELVPRRSDFHPRKAIDFLGDLVLIEVSPEHPMLKIRLAGRHIESRLQRTITGHNYLDYLPARYREGALLTGRLMVGHPCGVWQVAKVHYKRGLAWMMEQTGFPLGPAENGYPLLLVLANPASDAQPPTLKPDKAMVADTATKWEFLDVGAGIPEWTEENKQSV